MGRKFGAAKRRPLTMIENVFSRWKRSNPFETIKVLFSGIVPNQLRIDQGAISYSPSLLSFSTEYHFDGKKTALTKLQEPSG